MQAYKCAAGFTAAYEQCVVEEQVSCVLALGRRGQQMRAESRHASRAAAGPLSNPAFCSSILMPCPSPPPAIIPMPQVCPVESQWVQAILPRLEGIDVNRLR